MFSKRTAQVEILQLFQHTPQKRSKRAGERAAAPNESNAEERGVFTRKPQLFLLSVVDRYLSIGAKTEKSTRGGAGKVAQWVKEPVPSLSSTPRIHILEREK